MATGDGHPAPPHLGWSEEALRRQSRSAEEPTWLLDRRLQANRSLIDDPRPELGIDLASVFGAGAGARRAEPEGEIGDEVLPAEARRQGVILCSLATAVRDHGDLVERHLDSVIARDHGAADDEQTLVALNASAWSAGTFIYVPPGVEVDVPIQRASRSRTGTRGRFERTLLVADTGSRVHYIEGCASPVYSADPVRSMVSEVVVGSQAEVEYTTIQNWSANVSNLVVKRAVVSAGGRMTWIDGNIGGQLTMTHPMVVLAGRGATGRVRSVTVAGRDQRQTVGARMVHVAPETVSEVVAKTVSRDGGRCHHDGLILVEAEAVGATANVACDHLVLDGGPTIEPRLQRRIAAPQVEVVERDTSVSLEQDQLFYLMARGLSRDRASSLVINGFIEPVIGDLPMEYAVEWTRLVELQMAGSIG